MPVTATEDIRFNPEIFGVKLNPAVLALRKVRKLREKLSKPVHISVKDRAAELIAAEIIRRSLPLDTEEVDVRKALAELEQQALTKTLGVEGDPESAIKLESHLEVRYTYVGVYFEAKKTVLTAKTVWSSAAMWINIVNQIMYNTALASVLLHGVDGAVPWLWIYDITLEPVDKIEIENYPISKIVTRHSEERLKVTAYYRDREYLKHVADYQLPHKVAEKLEELLPPRPVPVVVTDLAELTSRDS